MPETNEDYSSPREERLRNKVDRLEQREERARAHLLESIPEKEKEFSQQVEEFLEETQDALDAIKEFSWDIQEWENLKERGVDPKVVEEEIKRSEKSRGEFTKRLEDAVLVLLGQCGLESERIRDLLRTAKQATAQYNEWADKQGNSPNYGSLELFVGGRKDPATGLYTSVRIASNNTEKDTGFDLTLRPYGESTIDSR